MYIYTYHERYYIVDCLYNMYIYIYICMQVWSFRKLNGGTPKSSKLDHFSIETIMVTWGSTILSNPHIISFGLCK